VTSGCFSPSLKVGIGIGRILTDADISQELCFGDTDNLNKATIAKRPFYTTGSLKN